MKPTAVLSIFLQTVFVDLMKHIEKNSWIKNHNEISGLISGRFDLI